VGLGGASRDDTNDFFVVFLILKSDVMLRNRVGIVENENGGLKANIVLAKILAVLVLIPYELHSKSRQDSIPVEMKDVNTFVRTSWVQGGAPIPHHRMWVRGPPSPLTSGNRRFSMFTPKAA
jgi:hypothetical protein